MSYVLIIDSSKADREIIMNSLLPAVVGTQIRCVDDPFLARELIAESDPCLILMDVDLPRMSGGEFLGHLMRNHPLPAVVVTRETEHEDKNRLEKLQLLGAIQTVYKPRMLEDRPRFASQLQKVVETVLSVQSSIAKSNKTELDSTVPEHSIPLSSTSEFPIPAVPLMIALGASTGGPIAISQVVRHFSANSPPVLIAQHISNRFLPTLVKGLQRVTEMNVSIAEQGMQVLSGGIYIAPPEHHMEIDSYGNIKLLTTVPTDRFSPAVNILFNSLARNRHTMTIAALLTGMGNDGAEGLLRLRNVGAITIAEHESSCVIYGMPARAAEIGAASEVLRLPEIGPRILQHVAQFENRKVPRQVQERVRS